jgi:transposase
MMGRQVAAPQLFYEFCLDDHVPEDHLLRRVDRFVDLESVRTELKPFYSMIGRPSIDPDLMLRMLIVGYCMGIRSERRLCDEVHLNLAYRWFCRLGLNGQVPDHSTFSRNRHGRFRESNILRRLFESVVELCLREGLIGGEASLWMRASSPPMLTSTVRSRAANGTPPTLDRTRAVPRASIWRRSTMPHSAQRPRASRSSSRRRTRPRNGRERSKGTPSSPMPRTT